jgi:hypothetical protein
LIEHVHSPSKFEDNNKMECQSDNEPDITFPDVSDLPSCENART